ncbi:MAG: nitrate/nitrite two-component system sensor histidine kinase NarQ [Pasteurellaceae bacterium]|nr:nitrate/nitrite two-component system sensor histidine kinase NarQ [Pasteurellaceae bacterium]
MNVKHSVSKRIAYYLYAIIGFTGLITALSIAIMISNKSDAQMINVSGSLRMQAYRLLHTMEYEPDTLELGLRQYQTTLHSSLFSNLQSQLWTPSSVKNAYQNLIVEWQQMETYAQRQQQQAYRQNISHYVMQVDQFVFALQRFAEHKQSLALGIIIFAMLVILVMVSYVIWFTRSKVVRPLQKLTRATAQMQMHQFNHIPLDTADQSELGILGRVFTQMSGELHKLYMNLEGKVNEKTQKLNQLNHSLSTLYHCSQQLSGSDIDQAKLHDVLQQIMISEHLRAIELDLIGAEHWNIQLGEENPHFTWQQQAISLNEQQLGNLRWQTGLPCADPRTMDNLVQILARALYFNQTQRQQQQLLLMEERSIIARELHDSLAQVLAFLQIQLTLLKNHLNKQTNEQSKTYSLAILNEFEQALRDGHTQLRELLTTFRLTIQEANLQLALQQVIDSLRSQTDIQLSLVCSLPSQLFNAQQQVHALQIVREALLNAIKHSHAHCIEIIAHTNAEGENEIIVRDDGIGIASLHEPDGHYGLNIMQERSAQLNATLMITNRITGGVEVKLLLPNTI